MSDKSTQWCVFLPCSADELWALPQNCVAEIVTVAAHGVQPPERVSWRGQDVPVLDLDAGNEQPWHESNGLIAVMLGLKGEGCDYWGVALRGEGLGMMDIAGKEVEDAPQLAQHRSVGAFRLAGSVYQIPDLLALQRDITAGLASA
jgi:hypothetical protein